MFSLLSLKLSGLKQVRFPSTFTSTSNSSLSNCSSITLPSIFKVFPEHFGLQPRISMNFKPNSPGSLLPSQYYHRANGGIGSIQGLGSSSTGPSVPLQLHPPQKLLPLHTQQYSNALKQIQLQQLQPHPQQQQQQQQRNGPINYYHHSGGVVKPVQQVHLYNNQFSNVDPASFARPIDRKRPFPRQIYSIPATSFRISSPQAPVTRPPIPLNPIKSSLDGSCVSGSTIQVKLNFRNFAMQLSSKSTNLTSNQAGTAAADKEHFTAVMQDCVIATSVDFIHSFPDYRPTVNNKLKPLKFIEFVQEQLYLNYNESSGFLSDLPLKEDLVFFYRFPDNLAAKHPEMPRFRLFRHSRNIGIAVYRNGKRIFPVTPEDILDFWTLIPRNKPVVSKERALLDLRNDDMILICRGYGDTLENEADALAEDASRVPPGGDLDDVLPPAGHVLDDLRGETATVIAVMNPEFDEYLLQDAKYRIRHVIHAEKTGHAAVDEPWPYAITKHTLVMRPYLALLYSDASKINRFSPTIEFILRKAMSAPLGESILKFLGKLSEIQHMAAGLVVGDKLRYWATGGAFIVHLRRENPKSIEWKINFPGLKSWSSCESSSIPIGEISVEDGDCLLLCCPEIRVNWSEAEIISVIKSRALWPEKFQIFTNRLKEEKNSKNGLGFYEIHLRP